MRVFTICLFLILVTFLFDKVCLWLEQKGWLYYRHKKPQGGLGNALLELQSFLNPATRNVVEMKQNKVQFKRSETDVPSEPDK